MATSDRRESDRFDDEILRAIDAGVAKIWTHTPAILQSYDPDAGTAEVQPDLRRWFEGDDGEPEAFKLPTLKNVPVEIYSGGGFLVAPPLTKGSPGTLWFTDRSIQEWKDTGGGDVTPEDRRRYAVGDAIFRPGLHSPAKQLGQLSATDLVIGEDGEAGEPLKQLRFGPTGISLGDGTNDVLDVLADTLDALATTPQVLVVVSHSPPAAPVVTVTVAAGFAATINALKAQIDAIRTP